MRSCYQCHPTTGPVGSRCAFPDQRYQEEGVGATTWTCTSLLLAVLISLTTGLTLRLQQVSNLVQKAAGAKVDPLDAHKFIQSVAEQQGAFLEYNLDAQGCLEAVVWALPGQVEAMQLYGDVWIQDNTCKTLAANRPFFAIVGVDGNSRYCLYVSASAHPDTLHCH